MALSATFLLVYEISREPLNGFALRQIHGKRVLSLARTSLKFKVNFGGLRAVYVLEKIFALVCNIMLASILTTQCSSNSRNGQKLKRE